MKARIVGAFALTASLLPLAAFSAERPPQFIAISFDNCSELERWQELSDFVGRTKSDEWRIRLTFFVSGANFLPSANRTAYRGPGQPAGVANIAFGGTSEEVRRRIEFINRFHADGHEIASHAVGHFDGKAWSSPEWAQEFHAYNELFAAAGGFTFPASDIKGFRAPYLGRGPALYSALRNARFRYDASGVGDAQAWPEKKDGVWRFNLASLRIAGSGKYTLSMDYNFLVAQSGVTGNPRMRDIYRDQMLRTYLAYFRTNYTGNRAPLHIGHHFSPMQGGAYNDALKTFVRTVCGLPEVRCVTYGSLADFLDGLDGSTLQAYQRGDFPRAPDPLIGIAVAESPGAL